MGARQLPPIGKKFGRLTVLSVRWCGQAQANCRCDCGTQKEVRLSRVKQGKVSSCGCLLREAQAAEKARRREAIAPLRARALQRSDEVGTKAAAHECGVHPSTLIRWRSERACDDA